MAIAHYQSKNNPSRASISRNQSTSLYGPFVHNNSSNKNNFSYHDDNINHRSKESCLPFSLSHHQTNNHFLGRSSISLNSSDHRKRSTDRSTNTSSFRRHPSPVPPPPNGPSSLNSLSSLDRSTSSRLQSALKLPSHLFSRKNRYSNPITLPVSGNLNHSSSVLNSTSSSTSNHNRSNTSKTGIIRIIQTPDQALVEPVPSDEYQATSQVQTPSHTTGLLKVSTGTVTSSRSTSPISQSIDPKLYPISSGALTLTRLNHQNSQPLSILSDPNSKHSQSKGRVSLDQLPPNNSKPSPQTNQNLSYEALRDSSQELSRFYRSNQTFNSNKLEIYQQHSAKNQQTDHGPSSGYQSWAARSVSLVQDLKSHNASQQDHSSNLDLGIAITTDVPQPVRPLRSIQITPSPPRSNTPSINRSSPPTQSSKQRSSQSDQQHTLPSSLNNSPGPYHPQSPLGLKPLHAPSLEKGKVPVGVLPRRPIGTISPPPPSGLSPSLRKSSSIDSRKDKDTRNSSSNLSQLDLHGSRSRTQSESMVEPWQAHLNKSTRLSASPIAKEAVLAEEPFQAWLIKPPCFDTGSESPVKSNLIVVKLNVGGTIFMTRSEVLLNLPSKLKSYLKAVIELGEQTKREVINPAVSREDGEKDEGGKREDIWLESISGSTKGSSEDTDDENPDIQQWQSDVIHDRSSSLMSSATQIDDERNRFSIEGEDDIDSQTMVGSSSRYSMEPMKQMKNKLMSKIVEEEDESNREHDLEIFLDRNPTCYSFILDCLRFPDRIDSLIERNLSKLNILINDHSQNHVRQYQQQTAVQLLNEILVEVVLSTLCISLSLVFFLE
ncbi:hypothetical protein BY996DRAFT_914335 [Phakopsora pachyrhizi]|nr:hypothetical protein BY996DRAFT_914335 [Phakopsora pachyrhizi]